MLFRSRNLFPSPSKFSLRPGALTTAFFPRLENEISLALVVLIPPYTTHGERFVTRILWSYLAFTGRMLTLPLELTLQECRYNRRTLEKIRDQRAISLGQLAKLRSNINVTETAGQYKSFLCRLVQILSPDADMDRKDSTSTSAELLLNLSTSLLPSLSSIHTSSLHSFSPPTSPSSSVLRPASLIRLWPHLIVVSSLSLYFYKSHTYWVPALLDLAYDTKDTIRGFISGWLIEPLKEVLRTIRGDEGQGGIVRTENVRADLEVRINQLSLISIFMYSYNLFIF